MPGPTVLFHSLSVSLALTVFVATAGVWIHQRCSKNSRHATCSPAQRQVSHSLSLAGERGAAFHDWRVRPKAELKERGYHRGAILNEWPSLMAKCLNKEQRDISVWSNVCCVHDHSVNLKMRVSDPYLRLTGTVQGQLSTNNTVLKTLHLKIGYTLTSSQRKWSVLCVQK